MDRGVIVFGVIMVCIIIITLVIVIISKRGGVQLDTHKYQARWLKVENSLKPHEPSTIQMAIINADKLVDTALKEKGVKGRTMGDRMKSVDDTWSNTNHIWAAHKIRNRIAHEAAAEISFDMARRTLSAYKQALKDLGAI